MPYSTRTARISFAKARIEQLEAIITESAGMTAVSVNGTSTTYADVLKQREYWLNELSRLEGTIARTKTIRLGGAG
jgi:hypothetical protein